MVDVTSTQTVSGSGSSVIIEEENRYRDTEIVDSARTLELNICFAVLKPDLLKKFADFVIL